MLIILDIINVNVYNCIVKVVDQGKYQIYVYKDHNPPHCHIYGSDGSVWIITIPDLQVMVGGPLNRKLKQLILDNLSDLGNMWDKLNNTTI
jgi:hypothetical protein